MTSKIVVNNIEADSGISTVAFNDQIRVGSATTIHSTGIDLGSGNINSHNINSTGIITATSATFSGNVSVGGTLSYEDVTYVDSVGIITAQSGIHVTGGSVGINDISPSRALSIKYNDNTAYSTAAYTPNGGVIKILNESTTAGCTAGEILFGARNSGTGYASINAISPGSQEVELAFRVMDGATFNEALRINKSGNIGIGTDNPTELLHLQSGWTKQILKSTNLNTASSLIFDTQNINTADFLLGQLTGRWNGNDVAYINFEAGSDTTNDDDGVITFLTSASGSSPTERLRIASDGDLEYRYNDADTSAEVGATQVPHGLRIYNTNNTTGRLSGISFSHGGAGSANVGIFHEQLNTSTSSGSSLGDLTFYTKNSGVSHMSEKVRITSAGYLGINNTNPRGIVHVGADLASSATDAAAINLKQTSTTAATGIYLERSGERRGYAIYVGGGLDSLNFQRNNAGTKSDVMTMTRDGNIGIGLADPGTKLEISGGQNQTANTVVDLFRIAANANNDSLDAEMQLNFGISASHTSTANRKARIQAITHAGTARELIINPTGGYVGVGTDDPTHPLHINSTGTSYLKFSDEASGAGGTQGAIFGLDNPHLYAWNYQAGDFVVATSATEKIRITSTGEISYAGNLITLKNTGGTVLQSVQPGVAYKNLTIRANETSFGTGAGSALERFRISSNGEIIQFNDLPYQQRGYFHTHTASQNASNCPNMSGILSYSFGYQEAYSTTGGTWVNPYPNLVLGYHTGVQIGGYFGYGGTRFYADQPSRTSTILMSVGNGGNGVSVTNTLSKGGGTFRIAHPHPSKKYTHDLQHSFIEGPQCDNLYRGRVDLVDGTASINIDIASNMTDGTFVLLNRDIQCFTSNETGWDPVKGSVSGNILTITSQNNSSTDTISWMVIGERQDDKIKSHEMEMTDSDGKLIVEPLTIEQSHM